MVVLTVRARAEARAAVHWLHDRSPAAATRWYAGLAKAINTLDRNPERHPVSEDASARFGFEVREMLYRQRRRVYRILFSVEGAVVNVLAIRHSAQGPIEP
jgi:plasmid stabilization system protein ParE